MKCEKRHASTPPEMDDDLEKNVGVSLTNSVQSRGRHSMTHVDREKKDYF